MRERPSPCSDPAVRLLPPVRWRPRMGGSGLARGSESHPRRPPLRRARRLVGVALVGRGNLRDNRWTLSPSTRATVLLQRLRDGDAGAADELLPLVHAELHDLARRAMGRQRADHTLQPTALLNEAWIRLTERPGDYEGRSHFLGVAARAMRTILIDHARRRRAAKRSSGGERIELDALLQPYEERAIDLVALDGALEELAQVDAELVHLVELRFFAGLTHEDIAQARGCSVRTIERSWSTARSWLRHRLGPGSEPLA